MKQGPSVAEADHRGTDHREPPETALAVSVVMPAFNEAEILESSVRAQPDRFRPDQVATLGRAYVESEMLRLHVRRRLSERLDGITHGPDGSIDKLLMTETEQAVGHAALALRGAATDRGDDTWLKVYLYSRAQSVMGGTAQIQRNLIAQRILGLPTA